ncbi:MAG TPA: chemotaxis protein CheW [Syntrophomonas sp.]|nr:chemotaxis protein CheW [Syntrophomonas sp.]HRW11902.1 chemotaxis protein CheW [Syntrophomonas sp.]
MSLSKVPLEKNQSPGETMQVVVFFLAGAEYAVEIKQVEEINRLLNITRVPHAPSYIEGVINLRGNIIPVINLHKKFNLSGQEFDPQTRIIVLKINDLNAAIIVDRVSEVIYLEVDHIVADTQFFSPINAEVIEGMVKREDRLIIVLDLLKLLNKEIN